MAHTKGGDDVTIAGVARPDTTTPVPHGPRPLPMARRGVPEGGGGGEGSGGAGGGGGNTARPGGNTATPTSASAARSASGGGLDFRQIFTGATLKKIIGLPGIIADVILAKITAPEGGQLYGIAQDKSDVYVGFQDIITKHFGIGRLFAPHSIFWRLPTNGSSAMVLKPSEADGTGIPYVLHGDGGNPRATPVPDWLDQNNCGIQAPEAFHIESTNQGVIIKGVTSNGSAMTEIYLKPNGDIDISGGIGSNINISANGGGNIVLNGGSLNVARKTDKVAADSTMATWITNVNSALSTLGQPVTAPTTFGVINGGASNVKG